MRNTPDNTRKQAIAARFSAAEHYDQAAHIQRRCAQLTADILASSCTLPPQNILEFGCGTGLLTAHLHQLFPHATLLATDIAPGMLTRAGARLQHDTIHYHQMDGEHPDIPGPFDLITSSLCMQWFQNRPAALERLCSRLAPGGKLIVATLLEGSLQEWVQSCTAESAPYGVPHYPSTAALAQEWPHSVPGSGAWQEHVLHDPTPSAAAFLRGLRHIGASLPRENSRPASSAALRRAMKHFDLHHKSITYRVGVGIFQKGHTA